MLYENKLSRLVDLWLLIEYLLEIFFVNGFVVIIEIVLLVVVKFVKFISLVMLNFLFFFVWICCVNKFNKNWILLL